MPPRLPSTTYTALNSVPTQFIFLALKLIVPVAPIYGFIILFSIKLFFLIINGASIASSHRSRQTISIIRCCSTKHCKTRSIGRITTHRFLKTGFNK
jgi:hypothetical protein